jgi:hypothetical protein
VVENKKIIPTNPPEFFIWRIKTPACPKNRFFCGFLKNFLLVLAPPFSKISVLGRSGENFIYPFAAIRRGGVAPHLIDHAPE